jgi:hypothetical protein
MRCYYVACDCPAAYVQLKTESEIQFFGASSWPGKKNVAFQACEAHGIVFHWDSAEIRKQYDVLTAEEFEVYRVHEE